jgi:chromatin remodeling complex protein RSC6
MPAKKVAKKVEVEAPVVVEKPVKVVAPKEPKEAPKAEKPKVEKVAAPTEEKAKRTKRVVVKEDVVEMFKQLEEKLASEIEAIRAQKEAKKKKVITGIKGLRGLGKMFKKLKTDTFRVLKIKTSAPRKTDPRAGFNKLYRLSSDMYTFTGWAPNSMHSRNEVTKFMAVYIKEHNLQKPTFKSDILPDVKLQKLLGYDPKNIPIGPIKVKELDPVTGKKVKKVIQGPLVLNYFRLQTWLQPHYIKEPVVEAQVVA